MSFKAMAWAWQQNLPASQKLVLMALADCHNGSTGQCTPSIAYLAWASGVAERTIQRSIEEIVGAGLVTKVARKTAKGRTLSFAYLLRLDVVVAREPWDTQREAKSRLAEGETDEDEEIPAPDSLAGMGVTVAPSTRHIDTHDPVTVTPSGVTMTTSTGVTVTPKPRIEPRTVPKKERGETDASLPDWMPKEAWDGFVQMRKKTKKPMTERAAALMIRKLDDYRRQGHDIVAMLDQSVISNWQDVYPPKHDQRAPLPASQQFDLAADPWGMNAWIATLGLTERVTDSVTKEKVPAINLMGVAFEVERVCSIAGIPRTARPKLDALLGWLKADLDLGTRKVFDAIKAAAKDSRGSIGSLTYLDGPIRRVARRNDDVDLYATDDDYVKREEWGG